MIAGSAALTWLFFREPFDLTISVDTLQKMTPLARDIVLRRQELMGLGLGVLPFVGISGGSLGVALVAYGLYRWIPYQRDYEQLQRTARQRAEWEFRQMTNAEIVEKAKLEIAVQQPASASGVPTQGGPSAIDMAVTDYLDTERALFDAMAERLPDDYELLPHQHSPHYAFDALLRSRSGKGPEYIVEFKNLSRSTSARHLVEALRQVSQAAAWLGFERKVKQVPLVIAVTPEITARPVEEATRFLRETTGNPTAYGSSLVRLLSPRRLRTLSARDVHALLDTSQRLLVFADDDPYNQQGQE